jgi:16S rRNA (guanine(527)-N(7))-methyltransferase RsmG
MSRSGVEKAWREIATDVPEADWQRSGPLLDLYLELVLQHAKTRNLLSQADRNPAALWRHVDDCLHALRILGADGAGHVMDVGSGSGLPGVPLALAMPGSRFSLLDRSSGKVEFLELVVARLELRNVRVLCGEFGPAILEKEDPDVLLSRAVKGKDIFAYKLAKAGSFPTSIIFATHKNESDWIRLATRAQLGLVERVTYSLPNSAVGRVLLKFAPL